MERWIITATWMTRYLNEAMKLGEFKEAIKPEVLRSAKAFFATLKPLIAKEANEFPLPGGDETYEIVRYLLARQYSEITEQEIHDLMTHMCLTMEILAPPQKIEHGSIGEEIFGKLHDLFQKMYEIGGHENYEEMRAEADRGMPR